MSKNSEWTAYACPECGESELEVQVLTYALMTFDEDGNVDGTDTTESENGHHEWDRESGMVCCTCGHSGTAGDFEQDEPKDEDEDETCSCDDRSWYGPEHDSACAFAGKPRWFECANCALEHATEELETVEDLAERVAPGETVPYGQCPECGALCYPKESSATAGTV